MKGYKSRFGVGTLSLALGKLYEDPMVIYREYIQNACDGIELAIKEGKLKSNEAVISIQIERDEISIKDRGIGVKTTEIGPRLVDPGNSDKYKDNLIGQYGIGRLIAAQYCEKIVFETSSPGENQKSILTWDTAKAFEMINSKEYEDGTEIIDKVTSVVFENEAEDEHYFRVKLCGIKRRIDSLVNLQKVKEYVSMMAPVDYTMEFKEGYLYPALEENPEFKSLYEKERIYKVIINDEDIRKPYKIDLAEKETELMTPFFTKFEDPDDGLLGWGWYAINKKVIQMNNVPFRGIRFRKLNTAVGNSNVMANYMKNVSINYFVGEMFLSHEGIQPTGSRDGFVDSQEKADFDYIMSDKANDLYSLYDSASHMGSGAIDKLTNAHTKIEELKGNLANETDEREIKQIKKQITEQKKILADKAKEFEAYKKELSEIPGGEKVVDAVLEGRQEKLDSKIHKKKKSNSVSNNVDIKKIIKEQITKANKSNDKSESESDDSENSKNSEEPQDPKASFMSKLSREQKKFYEKVCKVIDNEPSLTPSIIESLKMKILKKIAR